MEQRCYPKIQDKSRPYGVVHEAEEPTPIALPPASGLEYQLGGAFSVKQVVL
jgi:hypothetical protein